MRQAVEAKFLEQVIIEYSDNVNRMIVRSDMRGEFECHLIEPGSVSRKIQRRIGKFG